MRTLKWVLLLTCSAIFISITAFADTNINIDSKYAQEELSSLPGIIIQKAVFRNGDNINEIKYLVFDKNAPIEFIDKESQRLVDIRNLTGIKDFGWLDQHIFAWKAIDVWNDNVSRNVYIGAKYFDDGTLMEYNVGMLDQQEFQSVKCNPKLSEMNREYYILWNDTGACPLKIKAYKISVMNPINVDLVVKNTSNKTIAAFRGVFEMYDKFGHPVTWGGGSNKFKFIHQNDPVPAHSNCIEFGSWELILYDNTRKVKPRITEILYDDGTKWVAKK